MARKRMIDPTIWADEDFGTLSPNAMVLYIGMISNADDEGRLPGNPIYLSSTIFPYIPFDHKKSLELRTEVLQKMKSLTLYQIDGKEYLQFTKWLQYQSINKSTKSKYPPLPDNYRSPTVVLPDKIIEKERKEKHTVNYLINIPSTDLQELVDATSANPRQVKDKGDELYNYCKAKGRQYSDYQAFLRNALKKDYPRKEDVAFLADLVSASTE